MMGCDDDGNGHVDDAHGHNPVSGMSWSIRDAEVHDDKGKNAGDLGYGIYAVGMAVVASNNGAGALGTVGGMGRNDGAKSTLR